MAVYVGNITVGLDEDQEKCYDIALGKLGVSPEEVTQRYIVKRSVDARKKNQIVFLYTVGFTLKHQELVQPSQDIRVVEGQTLEFTPGSTPMDAPPVIIGFGPAGIFCGLALARLGYRPLILERGSCVEERVAAVEQFRQNGQLLPECNVQFGEGGAGTFSDGKLTTRISDPRCDTVLREFVAAGAPEDILHSAKPHIGTDYLRQVVQAMRCEILALGGSIRFNTRVDEILLHNSSVCGVRVGEEKISAATVVLAAGHSARDTFGALAKLGLPMEVKPFSVGARIEHLQSEVDKALYGNFAGHPRLPRGEYQLSWRDEREHRAAYTFCMCPGGVVVPAASMEQTVVTNGMSQYSRDGLNANAALVVSVDSRDFGQNPMDAIAFQLAIEQRAYAVTGSYKAPAQTVGRFLNSKPGMEPSKIEPSYALGVVPSSLDSILPPLVCDYMRKGLRIMGQRQPGFAATQAVLTGPETRTSSPIRILRQESSLCSIGAAGLYPCGEGSGYAGGIMSAAVDGLRVAEKIISQYKPFA
ncbi:MAG: hypothetical protein RR022_00520 [Angelakisella sp.]